MSEFDDDGPFERDFDPTADAWFVNLLFWRPSLLSNAQMRLHFSKWDGRWSEQTENSLKRFKATGLDLNENWALTESHWMCPACGRRKEEIFRLSKRGILLAKLELHHDHMRDRLSHYIREKFGEDWLTDDLRPSVVLIGHIEELTSRFDRALICSECNTADGKVKARLREDMDPRFSFTPQEIGSFIRARPAQDHDIDYEKARRAWEAEKENFNRRLLLLDELLTLFKEKQIVRDRRGSVDAREIDYAFEPTRLLSEAFSRDARDTERIQLLGDLRTEFVARSTQRDSARLNPVMERDRAVFAPTDADYAAYTDPVSPRLWKAVEEGWSCPVCRRTKRETVRKSKAGKWMGSIRDHAEWIIETDAQTIRNRRRLFPEYRNDVFIKRREPALLCADCAGIGVMLGQRDQSIRDAHLTIEDRRSCLISSRPHGPHEIDFEIATQCAIANEPMASAIAAHAAYAAKVSNFAGRFERGIVWGYTEDVMHRELSRDVEVFHRIDDPTECLELAKWLLAQREAGVFDPDGEGTLKRALP